jgi:MFS transporter, putative metabolite:H+ symporter
MPAVSLGAQVDERLDRPVLGAVTMTLARYFYDAYIGTVSVFFLLIRTHRFFGDGSYAIIGPYMAEVLPASVRASGTGLGYGVGNLGKIIGPLGLALIIGSSNYVGPKATLDAVFSALLFLAFWYAFGACAFWLLGIETEGRSIEEIDGAFASQLSASRALASPPYSPNQRSAVSL